MHTHYWKASFCLLGLRWSLKFVQTMYHTFLKDLRHPNPINCSCLSTNSDLRAIPLSFGTETKFKVHQSKNTRIAHFRSQLSKCGYWGLLCTTAQRVQQIDWCCKCRQKGVHMNITRACWASHTIFCKHMTCMWLPCGYLLISSLQRPLVEMVACNKAWTGDNPIPAH